jgi:hypothetical protein
METLSVSLATSDEWPLMNRTRRLFPEPVKQNIRARMFSFFDEPDDIVSASWKHAPPILNACGGQVARTNAIAVAKIARIDYPRAW